MHHQLHHESMNDFPAFDSSNLCMEKSKTLPMPASTDSQLFHRSKGFRLAGRASSATRLFNNLKTRICRSRMLFSHNEEPESCISVRPRNHIRPSSPSDCTSKALKVDSVGSTLTACLEDSRDTFACHLCAFEADRITTLDRHLLNHHKIGLENLLKLVMTKTKEGLAEDNPQHSVLGLRQPYYRPQDEIIEEGEFIIETVAPKIKILKHSATNTENNLHEINSVVNEIEKFFKIKENGADLQNDEQDGGNLMSKMAALNQYMCKFVDSSNTLKKVLNQELDMKTEHLSGNEPIFKLGLGDRETPRNWDRAHSEKLERSRKYSDCNREEKTKLSADSFYF